MIYRIKKLYNAEVIFMIDLLVKMTKLYNFIGRNMMCDKWIAILAD